jgi:hypothetical protein
LRRLAGFGPEPKHLPSVKEIRAACAVIRESWSPAEYRRRAAWMFADGVHVEVTRASLDEATIEWSER